MKNRKPLIGVTPLYDPETDKWWMQLPYMSLISALFLIWVDDVGEGRNFFSREKKPNVGFVILFPLSRHSLGDDGSHPLQEKRSTFS